MTDQSQPTVDTAGVGRTTDGTIVDGQTTQTDQQTQTDQSSQNTSQETRKTILNQDQAQDQKTTQTDKKDGEAKDGDDKSEDKSGAPAEYAEYKLPEGYTLDPESKAKVNSMFKDMGLSQDNAQKLVDFYIESTKEAFGQPYKAYQEMTDGWLTEAQNHYDLKGKLGPGQDVNVRIAKMYDTIGDPKLVQDFKALMDLTGAGNHQAFIRVLNKLAMKVTEGTPVSGKGPSEHGQSDKGQKAPPTAAAAIWPSLPSSNR